MSKLLILLFLISYVVSLTIGALVPQHRKVKELQKKVANREVVLKTRTDYINQLKEYSRRIDEHEVELGKMDYAMPPKPDHSYILEFLNKAFSDTGMVFREVSGLSTSVKGTGEEKTEWVELSVRLSGTYNSFLDLLSQVEKTARLIEVDTISFSEEEIGEGEERPEVEEGEAPSIFTYEVRFRAPYFSIDE